ncbi:MAG: hypothetical protein IAF38_11445 [Bacteroidia bacterium]|nr:hypothetical protein [Bacteroidia bacterium]
MKTIVTSILTLLFVNLCVSQSNFKFTPNKREINSYEIILVYGSTTTSTMGEASYNFTNDKGENVEFVLLDEKNYELKKLFENGNVKEAKEKGDYTVKTSVGKKFRIKYKVQKGQENLAWAAKTIVTALEVFDQKKAGN